ncbi:MAG: hypothetical protein J6Q85_07930 [Clostridia bacterium]|nr:hypothetical protein [Clostridia bacterium]
MYLEIKSKIKELYSKTCDKIKGALCAAPSLIVDLNLPKCKLLCEKHAKTYAECEVDFKVYGTRSGNIFLSRCHGAELFSEDALSCFLYSVDDFSPVAVISYSVEGGDVVAKGKRVSGHLQELIPSVCSAILTDARGELGYEYPSFYFNEALCEDASKCADATEEKS